MDLKNELAGMLDETLNLGGRAQRFERSTPLLGALPELDSMAVVALIAAMEDRFGFSVADDEIDGQAFENFGALCDFVAQKRGQPAA